MADLTKARAGIEPRKARLLKRESDPANRLVLERLLQVAEQNHFGLDPVTAVDELARSWRRRGKPLLDLLWHDPDTGRLRAVPWVEERLLGLCDDDTKATLPLEVLALRLVLVWEGGTRTSVAKALGINPGSMSKARKYENVRKAIRYYEIRATEERARNSPMRGQKIDGVADALDRDTRGTPKRMR